MFCRVYFRCSKGKERAPDAVRRSAVVGDLRFEVGLWDERPGRRVMRATLLGDDGETYRLPVIDQAHIEVRSAGIWIEGVEVIPKKAYGMKNIKADYYPQTWWCVPVPVEKRRPPPVPVTALFAEDFD